MTDLFNSSNGKRNEKRNDQPLGDVVKVYRYRDEESRDLFQVVKFEPKTFRPRYRVNGKWEWGLPEDVRRVLYRLPEVVRAIEAGETVFVTEGEKDADRLRKIRLVATTNQGGVGAGWRDEYTESLRGADVVLIADNDDPDEHNGKNPGVDRVVDIVNQLDGVAASVKAFMPPKVGFDISDHLDAGLRLEDLVPVEVPVESSDEDVDPDRYFDRDGFIPSMLGAEIREQYGVRVGAGQHLHWYKGGVFLDTGEELAKAVTRRVLGERFKRRHAEEVIAWLKARLQDLPDIPNPDFVNVANGMLYWRTGELVPHSPDFASLVQVPVRWEPDAKCPKVDKFIKEVLPHDAQGLAREILGYALLPDAPMRRAFMLVGSGSNGKSRFLGLVRALVGPQNCTAIPLQTFGENRFATADVYGKFANLCGDLDASALRRSDIFKILTGGGDAVSAERKYGKRFEFVPFVKLMFSANEVPPSHDQSEAIFDRWVVLPFDRRFSEDDGTADPHLLGKITTRAELEGLLVQAVEGLRRLMGRGHFDLPASVLAANADYRGKVDTVAAFVDECCELALDRSVTRSRLYDAYRDWCQTNGRHPVSQQNFTTRFKEVYRAELEAGEIEERIGRGVRRWQGLRCRF